MGNVVARLLGCRPTFRDEEEQPATKDEASKRSRQKQKYACIPDNYTSDLVVTDALRGAGLESSNLILGIDFTRSNEWTGKRSFHDLSLHNISNHRLNPYQQAIAIIGKVLASFDEDNLIPCFGFGDSTTRDQGVFSFRSDHSPCHGFEEVLRCYRRVCATLAIIRAYFLCTDRGDRRRHCREQWRAISCAGHHCRRPGLQRPQQRTGNNRVNRDGQCSSIVDRACWSWRRAVG
ncbi:unnamed protein product [Musa textilis]